MSSMVVQFASCSFAKSYIRLREISGIDIPDSCLMVEPWGRLRQFSWEVTTKPDPESLGF